LARRRKVMGPALDPRVIDTMARELLPLAERLGVKAIGPDGKVRAILLLLAGSLVGEALRREALQEGSTHPCPSCGKQAKRLYRRKRKVLTVGGWASFSRSEYKCLCEKKFTPLDDKLGLVPSSDCTAAMRELISFTQGEETVRESSKTLEKFLDFSVAPSVVNRAAQVEGARAERILETQSPDPPQAPQKVPETLLVEIDGCQVPHRDGWHETKVGVATDAAARVEKPPSSGEIELAKKEGREPRGREMLLEKAYVADARSLESFKQRLWGECVRQGVEKVRRIMVLGDGAVWIGNTAIELFRFPDARDPTERPPPEVIRAVDWYHATEHVWAATELVHGTRDSEEAKRWVKHWETCLWEKGDAQGLAEEIQQKAADHRGERREDLVRAANYFRNNAEGMRYQKFREMGLPVGSGPVEGSCKFVAQSRCKKVGQRWLKDGLNRILALRLFRLNDRWNELWPEAA